MESREGPNGPRMEVDFRSATEAMQRAADAMMAATESFRRQFEDDSVAQGMPRRPLTYHPYREADMHDGDSPPSSNESAGGRKARHTSLQMPPTSTSITGSALTASPGFTAANFSRPDMNNTSFLALPAPAYASSQTYLPAAYPAFAPPPTDFPRPTRMMEMPRLETAGHRSQSRSRSRSSSFGARVVPGQPRRMSQEGVVSMTPTAEWPVMSGSQPNLATTLAAPALKPGSSHGGGGGGRGAGYGYRSSAPQNHVDLFEAASRLSQPRPQSHQGSYQSSYKGAAFADDAFDEPSPVVQIGRYTYVRSETDDLQAALIRDEMLEMQQRSGQGSAIKPPSTRRPSTRGRPPPAGAPYGFSLVHEIMFVLVICLSQMLMLAGIAQALVPATIIGQSFPDTSPGDLAWYSAAYGLTAGTFVLPSGRLGDLFGHKRIFIIGFIWFAAWSLVAGFAGMAQQAGADGTIFFCFSRAMQGIGPALLVPNGQAMLGRAYKPGPRKNLVMCLFGAAAPLGFVTGAVMASLFAERASWPWAFWTMAAVCVALAVASIPVLPSADAAPRRQQPRDSSGSDDDDAKKPRESLWVRLDGLGMVLGVSGLVLFNFAFNQAPIVRWTTPYTYFILIIAVLLLAAFVYVEFKTARHPLVPIAAMTAQTNFVLSCTAAGWGCFSVWVYYAFAVIENLRGWGPLLASAGFAHAPLSGLAASLLTGFLMARVRPHWIMLASMCAFFAGSALFATAPVDQSYWFNTFFSILVMPFGMDMSNPAATILLSNSVSREHQGIAASLVVTVVNYSISLALGVAGTIEVHIDPDGTNLLAGYRGAQYFGLGLGGLGIALGTAFLILAYVRSPPPKAA